MPIKKITILKVSDIGLSSVILRRGRGVSVRCNTVSTHNSCYPWANELIFQCLNFLLSKISSFSTQQDSLWFNSFVEMGGDGTQWNQIPHLSRSRVMVVASRELRNLQFWWDLNEDFPSLGPSYPPPIFSHPRHSR